MYETKPTVQWSGLATRRHRASIFLFSQHRQPRRRHVEVTEPSTPNQAISLATKAIITSEYAQEYPICRVQHSLNVTTTPSPKVHLEMKIYIIEHKMFKKGEFNTSRV